MKKRKEPRNYVKKFRLSQGLTVTDLSRKAGVSTKVIAKMEETPPEGTRTTSKVKVSRGLDKDPADVFPNDEEIAQNLG